MLTSLAALARWGAAVLAAAFVLSCAADSPAATRVSFAPAGTAAPQVAVAPGSPFATGETPAAAPSSSEGGRGPATGIIPSASRPGTPLPPGSPTGQSGVVDRVLVSGGATAPSQFPNEEPDRRECCIQLRPEGATRAAAWLDADRMYLADHNGQLRLLNVATGEIKTVLEGLSFPKGLTVLEGRLYIADMGNVCALLTKEERRACRPLLDRSNQQILELLRQSNARVLSYRIDAAGELDDRQVALEGILGISKKHGPNAVTNDGEWVYVSIAHPMSEQPDTEGDFITAAAEQLASEGGRPDLMGTVARFRPGDTEVEVYANGLHSAQGLAVAPDGTIYGVDHAVAGAGSAVSRQRVELNALVEGGFYGYPLRGADEKPQEFRVTEPEVVLRGRDAKGIYANSQGVYVGYYAIEDSDHPPDRFVVNRFDYETFEPTEIFRQNLLKVHAILEREGLLYLVTTRVIYVIDSSLTEAEQVSGFARRFAEEVEQSIAADTPQISFTYEVYIRENDLVYVMEPCDEADMDRRFWLHVIPVNRQDLPEYRREYGFDLYDFRLRGYGVRNGQRCVAVVQLPQHYVIGQIKTGFYDDWRWERAINLALPETGRQYPDGPEQEAAGGPGDGL